MGAVNVSLPNNLKEQADDLVKKGHYSSFSDVVRTALRDLVQRSKYDIWIEEAKEDVKGGRATVLKTDKDIEEYISTLSKV